MSRLDPTVLPLDKGLNLQTAKILAPAGSALSSLNYEHVDFQGQKRIDGYVRYDGSLPSSIDEYYIITDPRVTYEQNLKHLALVGNKVIGVVVGYTDEGDTVTAVIDYKLLAELQHTSGTEYTGDPELHYQNLLTYNALLRQDTERLPGPVSGLHWFRDRLYGVADVAVVEILGRAYDLSRGDVLRDVYESVDAREILDYYHSHTGNTEVLLAGGSIQDWIDSGVTYLETGTGACAQHEIVTYYPSVDIDVLKAGIFEARTERQVNTENGTDAYDYGWKFNHTGWAIHFREGYSLFGSLPSINQNLKEVGVQGPTSVEDRNGSPLDLLQKIASPSLPVQANGWKVVGVPDSYNLDSTTLYSLDGEGVYADAYVAWEDEVGVSTPDIAPDRLEERPATAVIVMET